MTRVSSLTPNGSFFVQDYVHRIGRTARGPYGQGHAWSTQPWDVDTKDDVVRHPTGGNWWCNH